MGRARKQRKLRYVEQRLQKSLQELDGQDWGEPSYPSSLVVTCHRLRRKPLKDFTVEDLRIMIGQQIGLEHLIPLALDRLIDEPFAEGHFYPGDLLTSVMRVRDQFWSDRPELDARLRDVAVAALARLEALNADESALIPPIPPVVDIVQLRRLAARRGDGP